MRQPLQSIVRSAQSSPQAALARFGAPDDVRITGVSIFHADAGEDALTFDVNVNGVSIFDDPDDRPVIEEGEQSVFITGLEIYCDELDVITVDLDEGDTTAALYVQVVTDDAVTYDRLIIDLYSQALNRAADSTERAAEKTALAAAEGSYVAFKAAVRSMIAAVFNGSEYDALDTSDADFIEDLFRAALGRPSNADGFSFWQTFLSSHTRAETVAAFVLSDELKIDRLARAWWQAYANSDAASLRSILLPTGVPSVGDTILYNADGTWHYGAASGGGAPSGAASGDLSGNYPNPTVAKIYTRPVEDLTPILYFVDNFNDNSFDLSKWVTTGGTVAEQNGRIELSSDGAIHSAAVYTFADGSFISRSYNRNGTNTRLIMRLYWPSGVNVIDFTIQPDTGQVRLYKFVEGSFVAGTDYSYSDIADVKFMRLRYVSSSGTFHGETSPDGVTWTDRGNITPPTAPSNLTIHFATTSSSGTVWLDDFNSNLPVADFMRGGEFLSWSKSESQYNSTVRGLSVADIEPDAPTAFDDEFEGTALASKWAWLNQGTSTASVGNPPSHLALSPQMNGQMRGILQALPAQPWKFRTRLSFACAMGGTSAEGVHAGLIITPVANDSYEWLGLFINGASLVIMPSSAADLSTSPGGGARAARTWTSNIAFLQLDYDGSNLTAWASIDGIGWIRVIAPYAPNVVPYNIGLAAYHPAAGVVPTQYFNFFRRVG